MGNKAKKIKAPPRPRCLVEWEQGSWNGATSNKLKYLYCKSSQESLVDIVNKLKGKSTGDPEHPNYSKSLAWQEIAMLNFGTKNPEEINWHLETLNGCGDKVSADGANYELSKKDTRPWLWIPTEPDSKKITSGKTFEIVCHPAVQIMAGDGISQAPFVIPKKMSVDLKAVPMNGISGTYKWSTFSPNLNLKNATTDTVTVTAGENISDALNPEKILLEFTPTGASAATLMYPVSVVEVRFSKPNIVIYGYDNMGGTPGAVHHVSVGKYGINYSHVDIVGVQQAGLLALTAGNQFTFTSDDESIATVSAPVLRGTSFDITITAKDKKKAETTVNLCFFGSKCASLKVNVYKQKDITATMAKVYDSTSPSTRLTNNRFDVEAAERDINSWYKQGVVSIDLTDFSPTGDSVDVNFDASRTGMLILEPAAISPGEQAIRNKFNNADKHVVIVKDLTWHYYLSAAASAGDTRITLKNSYAGDYMDYLLAAQNATDINGRYDLGAGPTLEQVYVKNKNNTTIELWSPLGKNHPVSDFLAYPLGGLSGEPTYIIEQNYSVDNIRWVIAHECGHTLLDFKDLEAPLNTMHFEMGAYGHELLFRDLTKKYEAGNESQWEKIAR